MHVEKTLHSGIFVLIKIYLGKNPSCQPMEKQFFFIIWQQPANRHNRERAETYNSRDGEVTAVHLLSQPFHLTPSVTEDDSLGDGQGLIQITQSIQLPLLATTTTTTTTTKTNNHRSHQVSSFHC